MALRALAIAIAATLLAIVLLFPWPLAYARAGVDRSSLGLAFRPALELSHVLRFQTGPAGSGWVVWGLVVAAAVPLFVATGDRLSWAARGWVLALVGWAAVWVPARVVPDQPVPVPEAALVLPALGLALAIGVGVSILVDGVRTFRFGWRQPVTIIGGVALVFPALGFLGDAANGRWHAPSSDWTSTLAFTSALTARGQFRMLWIGDPRVLPLDPVVLRDGTGYSLTRNGPGDVTEQWRAPEHAADRVLDRAILLAEQGRTDRLGSLLAPMGVRYLVAPTTQGQDGGAAAPLGPVLRRALDAQIDLAHLRSGSGLVLYENLAYVPLLAVVPGAARGDVPVHPADPARAALTTDLSGARPVGTGPVRRGTVLWAESYDRDWRATSGATTLPHARSFSWGNQFQVARPGRVRVDDTAQWQRWAFLAGALVIWIAAAIRWRRTRVRRAPTPGARPQDDGATRARRDRTPPRDPFADAGDTDAFWWERV